MAGEVTELACLALKPGVDVQAVDSEGYKAIHYTVTTAVSQPGAQRVYYGLGIEDSSKLWFFLDWDSIQDHERFTQSEFYRPMLERLQPILDLPKVFIKHVSLQPFPPRHVLDNTRSSVTEVLSCYFSSDITSSAKATATSLLEEFVENGLKTCSDVKGVSLGWSIETDIPIPGESESTGAMLVALIGWPSVEAHLRFRETQPFKDNIGLLRNMPGLVKLSMFHVSCKSMPNSSTE